MTEPERKPPRKPVDPLARDAYNRLITPLQRRYERDRMVQLVDELYDALATDAPGWLRALGLTLVAGDGWFEARRGRACFIVEAGPELSLLIHHQSYRPEQPFYTHATLAVVKREIQAWGIAQLMDHIEN